MRGVTRGIGIFALPILLWALNPNAFWHNNNHLFYVNPAYKEVKLRVKQISITGIDVIVDSLRIPMSSGFREEPYDYYHATVNNLYQGTSYYFVAKSGQDSLRIPSMGFFTATPPQFTTPNWASGKTYYSIFADGFYNGDPDNDPDKVNDWGERPKGWTPYGGDLTGIHKKLAYIDSLKPDVILLQPIFRAESNHKLDPIDYTMIDPQFGDTIALKQLIDDIHRSNMKVVLNVPVTCTGLRFPTFEDIDKKGAESKYLNWYMIESTPIRTSPPTYHCWNGDHRFPKLNLSNPQVTSYLLGYMEYWKHFGFDGFYVGEDSIIDTTFIHTLRATFKSKYPDLLLIGSDRRQVTGTGLDGCWNHQTTKLLKAYFIDRSISTNEFDHALHKLLFFTPPQANRVNLVTISDHKSRNFASDIAMTKNLYAFMFTWVGSPVLLYGDEMGMKYSAPLNLGSFPWGIADQNRELFLEIKKLIAIRRDHSAFSNTAFYTLYVNDINRVYAYDRGGIIIVINNSDKETFVELPTWDGVYDDVFTGEKKTAYSQKLRLSIDPISYQILQREF